jgi:hypothetical protein
MGMKWRTKKRRKVVGGREDGNCLAGMAAKRAGVEPLVITKTQEHTFQMLLSFFATYSFVHRE